MQIEQVRRLLQDSLTGYSAAVERASDAQVKALLERVVRHRRACLKALAPFAADPTDMRGTRVGQLHQAWVGFRERIHALDDAALLTEGSIDDALVLQAYEAALAGDLPDDVRALLSQQRDDLRELQAYLDRAQEMLADGSLLDALPACLL